MMGAFNRPIGAAADVKELEYISVLQQTQLPELRKNCTVSATDISVFLHSRYGLNVPHEDALDIVQGFGGYRPNEDRITNSNNAAAIPAKTKNTAPHNEGLILQNTATNCPTDAPVEASRKSSTTPPEKYLDIVQLVGILLLPTLIQAAGMCNPRNGDGGDTVNNSDIPFPANEYHSDAVQPQAVPKHELWQTSPKIFLDVLRFIVVWLSDLDEGVANLDINDGDLELVLTESRMRLILGLIGEVDLTSDSELVKAMIEHCATRNERGEFVLNTKSFANALTSDVDLWNADWVDRKSTFYFDVFGAAVGQFDDLIQKKGLTSLSLLSPPNTSGHLAMKINNGKYVNVTTTDYSDFGIWFRMKQITNFISSSLAPQEQKMNHEEVDTIAENIQTKESISRIGITEHIHTNENDSFNSQSNGKPNDDIESSRNRICEKRRWTFSQSNNTGFIDFIVDAQWSRLYLAFAWSFFVTCSVVYSILFSSRSTALHCNTEQYGCTLLKTILAWLSTAVSLCVCGVIVFIPISLANGPFRRSMKLTAISLVSICLFTVPPFVGIMRWMKDIPHGEKYTAVEKTASQISFKVEIFVVLVSGLLLFFFIMTLMLATVMYLRNGERSPFLTFWVTTHDVISSYYGKLAGTYKLNKLVANAHKLHFIKTSQEATIQDTIKSSLLNYEVYGETEEVCGGLRWAWRGLCTRDLFQKEGFWLHSRLFISQLVQLFFGAWVSLIFFTQATEVAEQANTMRNDLLNDSINYPTWVYNLFPEGWMVKVSLYPAASIATCIMIFLFLFPFPSTASTVVKLRCGVIPSRQDPQFIKYRAAADTVSMNLGNSIFSIVGSGAFFFLLFGVIIFLSVWPYTKGYLLIIYAWLLGVFITIFLKTILMMVFRIRHHRALYRISQSSANITGLLLECWHIGVAPGFLISRLVQFLLASALWIGRLDVPFLSDDVCLFGYHFDSIPTNYRKDILTHEAHRHPYIERLGAMYMMRLKHGCHFGNRVGSCWRIVFVLFLMPWLRKYRVPCHEKLEDHLEVSLQNNVEKEEAEILPSTLTVNILDAVGAFSEAIMFDYVPSRDPVVKVPDSNEVLES